MPETNKNEGQAPLAGSQPPAAAPQSEMLLPTWERGQFEMRELIIEVWQRKWHILLVAAIFATFSAVYTLLATEWYTAEVVLAPIDSSQAVSLPGQLGGLAALAGVNLKADNSAEGLATIRSRDFAREFIRDEDLLPVFFSDSWNSEDKSWIGEEPSEWPDIRDGVIFFQENVLEVIEDRQSSLVTVEISWTDPTAAADWANKVVRRLNDRLRERSLREAMANVAYLRQELAKTSLVTLQQSIGGLLEGELQKVMLARGSEEFAFRIIDPATVPKYRSRPKRTLTVVLATVVGGGLAVSWVFFTVAFRERIDWTKRGSH